MNEARWHAATDARPLLDFLRTSGRGSERKLRLYTAAYWRQVDPFADHDRHHLGVVERIADGQATPADLALFHTEPKFARLPIGPPELLREIIGNPFQPITIDPAMRTWNAGCVERLAHAIYDERAFERLPILADALEEAGCDLAALLDHLRGPGPHFRGCWALDAVLGRA